MTQTLWQGKENGIRIKREHWKQTKTNAEMKTEAKGLGAERVWHICLSMDEERGKKQTGQLQHDKIVQPKNQAMHFWCQTNIYIYINTCIYTYICIYINTCWCQTNIHNICIYVYMFIYILMYAYI